MRRTFTLQMYQGPGAACEMPGDCGRTCHCGDDVERHGWGDPPHNPVPMLCGACQRKEAASRAKLEFYFDRDYRTS